MVKDKKTAAGALLFFVEGCVGCVMVGGYVGEELEFEAEVEVEVEFLGFVGIA